MHRYLLLTISILMAKNGLVISAPDQNYAWLDDAGYRSEISSENCISLDLTADSHKDANEFFYIWNFGDDSRDMGQKVNHCYQRPGDYHISLDLIDPETGVTLENDYETDVQILPSFSLGIKFTGNSNQVAEPNLYTEAVDYKVKYFWKVNDEYLQKERIDLNNFQDNEVTLGAEILHAGNSYRLKTMELKPASTGLELIGERFVADYRQGINLMTPEGNSFYAWAGNTLFYAPNVNSEEQNEKLTEEQVAELISSTSSITEISLEPIFHKMDEYNTTPEIEGQLLQIAEALKRHQGVQVTIGSYTHTGGLFEPNRVLSLKRSNGMKQFLVNQGIESTRLQVADPKTTKALVNSCEHYIECKQADERYNLKTEFKITGVKQLSYEN
ncbi:MAG: PKD domain-containing protein [Cyclobacteriaceae bacterium]